MKVLLIYIIVSLIIKFMLHNLRSSEYNDGYMPCKLNETDIKNKKEIEIIDWILSLIFGAIITAFISGSVW